MSNNAGGAAAMPRPTIGEIFFTRASVKMIFSMFNYGVVVCSTSDTSSHSSSKSCSNLSKVTTSSHQSTASSAYSTSSKKQHPPPRPCILWEDNHPYYTYLLCTKFDNKNPLKGEVTIPNVASNEELLKYLVPLYPTQGWLGRDAITLEEVPQNATDFEVTDNHFVILKPFVVELAKGKQLPPASNKKVSVAGLKYLNLLIDQVIREQSMLKKAAQDKIIRDIENRVDQTKISDNDSEDQGSLPITLGVQCHLLDQDVGENKYSDSTSESRIVLWLKTMEMSSDDLHDEEFLLDVSHDNVEEHTENIAIHTDLARQAFDIEIGRSIFNTKDSNEPVND